MKTADEWKECFLDRYVEKMDCIANVANELNQPELMPYVNMNSIHTQNCIKQFAREVQADALESAIRYIHELVDWK